jgi:hypothetical protein
VTDEPTEAQLQEQLRQAQDRHLRAIEENLTEASASLEKLVELERDLKGHLAPDELRLLQERIRECRDVLDNE